jgi:hypothetical protein
LAERARQGKLTEFEKRALGLDREYSYDKPKASPGGKKSKDKEPGACNRI